MAEKLEPKKKAFSLGIYTGIFIGSSTVTLPLITLLGYASWSPYNIAGLLANVLTIQCLFLAIGLIGIIYFEKRSYNASWIDFGLNKNTTLRAAVIGITISTFLIFGFFSLPNLPTGRFSFPRDWGGFFLIFLNYLLVSFVSELYLRGLIQTKLIKEESRLKNWINILCIALLGGLLQGISTFFVVLPAANYSITYAGFTFGIPLIGLVGGIVIFTVLGILNSWIFQKTQHVLPAAIVQAAMLSWFLISLMVQL